MPELPEVETVRLGLVPVMEGFYLTDVETRRDDLRIPFPRDFAARMRGRKVTALRRRAKYLLADLDSGETLVIHLGMSGRMSVYVHGKQRRIGSYVYDKAPEAAGTGKHDHVVFETDAPARIVFNDHRRFGLMTLVDTKTIEQDKLFKAIGIEPLSEKFNTAYLEKALDGKKTPIKSALLDQRLIAGLGNIYVCEALFRANISPKRLAGSIKKDRLPPLVAAIKKVLKDAIAAGATGDPGNFQHQFQVYGREGNPCKAKASSSESVGHKKPCKGTVKRIVQAGRSTFYCPKCQS
ncbi:MAG: bifunctional DNA-formamidopyrimidine glycosylase/DNA-(apurinic or apyrimidinic site) lyase [Alphaproteobacteria bacterium]|nr:bifunctional DNA-formamidopyrimidine glycosylase/DNA-(apurinic or apyrimidinic site) lyase [Alphaproteobacteria bacterium]